MHSETRDVPTLLGPTLSVVVPCYNEELVLEETHKRLLVALQALGCAFEIVYVDDGSRDGTARILRRLQSEFASVRVLGLSRNFGHQAAVSAGLDHARGRAVVVLDADLQDPPELIADMLALWRQGYHVVYGQRTSRAGESLFKRLTARVYYRAVNLVSDIPIPLDTGDFRLMDRRVVEVIKRMPERDRFLRGMVSWVGFKQSALPYDRAARHAGHTKYPIRRMLAFATDGILSFSVKPLQLATTLGFLTSGLAFLGIVYALLVRLFTTQWVSGWAFLIVSILFLGGIQLICLGIIGQYIGRMHVALKGRPLYVLAEALGFDPDDERAPRA